MSSTTSGSIVGYENNNDVKSKRPKTTLAPSRGCTPSLTGASGCQKRKRCATVHLNNLWSFWYGALGTVLQAYTSVKCIKRILGYSVMAWPEAHPLPILEMNASLGLTAAAVLLLPFFLASAAFKIGNLANDGFKLGRQLSTCSREKPADTLEGDGGCGLFKHGGPTAPFLHLVIAFSLLLPKLLMEARLIEAGLLPQESIWKTDLDFMVVHRDRLVVLSFMTSNNATLNHHHRVPSAAPFTAAFNATMASQNGTLLPSAASAPLFALGGGDNNTPSAVAFTHHVVKTLRDYIGHEKHDNLHIDSGMGSSVSIEYLNFAIALLVYSVRYPSLFWATNKCMGLLFSFQLLINGLQTLLSYAGMSVLYKVQIVGPWKALPLMKHHLGGVTSPLGGISPFLLNPQVTLALYILSLLLILASSLVLYLYGHTRFTSFLNQERERRVIVLKEGGHSKWSYFTHCAALCVLVSVGLCNAPLLHDYTMVYRGSLDGAILACIIGGILHLFIWIVVWLFLTIKQKWIFKLRVTVGRATVRQARSVKLVTDVDLMTNSSDDPATQPLLVVGNGRTYTVNELSPKKAIMGVIQKATMVKEPKSESGDDDEEQIYWLRPALVTPQGSPDGSKQLCWFNKKPKHKVTFNETTSTSNNRKSGSRRRVPGMEVDDGDYATLREVVPANHSDDNISEEGKSVVPTGLTPRCLRRADSGMPHEEFTPRSDSISTESSHSPPDPPGSNHSETSSGIHSNESSEHPPTSYPCSPPPTTMSTVPGITTNQHTRRATSVADLQQPMKEEIQWKSCSLQRGMAPPTSASFQQFASSPSTNSVYGYCNPNGNANYVNSADLDHNVILENPNDETVVIRRKAVRPKTTDVTSTPIIKEEPFGRATNMRMTSFTDDLKNIQASSATLPHYPTQPVVTMTNNYPHCSTMPLPVHTSNAIPTNLGGGNSCNVYPRQHSTIPTHHNGVRLFNNANAQNPYIKRLQCQNGPTVRYNPTNEPIYTGVNRTTGELYHYQS
ncbi:protein tincar-like isoform X2 [Atheta coriaria]|uniref:protein tincar-like isoform X2 n=1 Tax=Dalotia coriaria TaxID=877792 RepID=UPI0031F44F73